LEFLDQPADAMQKLSGLSDLSFGNVPKGGSQMAASTAAYLVEAEQIQFGGMIRNFSDFMKEFGQRYVWLSIKHVSTDRVAGRLDWQGYPDAVHYKGSDLLGNTSVFTNVGKGFGITPGRKLEQLMALLDRGVIDDKTLILRHADHLFNGRVLHDMNVAYTKAQRDLRAIVSQGVMPVASSFDPHMVIIQAVKNFMMQESYENLDLGTKRLINAYADSHMQYIQQERGTAQQQQQQQQGRPGTQAPLQSQRDAQIAQSPGRPQAG
jgi:hypothetical protein